MDLHQLKSFYYVANYLNFSKAAVKVSLSQPAVSRQIESLESYFNLPLFNRIGRRVELTDAGRRLLQYAEQILLLSKEAESAMRSFNNLEEGEINVGAGTTIGNYLLSSLIVDFQQRYPSIKINLFIDKTYSIIEKIKKGELDIAVVAKSTNYPEFNYKPLLIDEIILVGGSELRMNNSRTSNLHQLVEKTFLLRREGSNTRENTERLFKTHQFKPKRIIEFDTNEAIKNAIMKGYGIGFISELAIKNELDLNLVVP
ncbi:MAG TPA: LysR family transcriptional regulator, partial [Bacillales bacterium]|nr:LysR family transcriptional regulator [Bacillales bacterium]